MDVAIGAAYAGKRALATMKHVGLNVAADSFMYASMTGIEAGLVIVTADDPAMHSSQNEQDNRTFAKFARVPCLEPSDSQEAKDLTVAAFELSEQFDTPVLLRLTTRCAIRRARWNWTNQRMANADESAERCSSQFATSQFAIRPFPRNPAKYVMVPGNAVKRHPVIEARIRAVAEYAETCPFNRVEPGDRSLGVITCGVSYQYAKEVFPTASVLKLGMTWPLPEKLIRDFAASVDRLIVIEELDPFIEEAVKLWGIPCEGKSIFPLIGEFDPRVVRENAIKSGPSARVSARGVDGGGCRPTARPPARALPRLPAPQRVLRAEQAQGAGQRRYRLLHPGPDRAAERDPHLRLHGRGDRGGARRSQGRQPGASRGSDRRFDLLPHRHPGAGERGLQPEPGDHDHHGQPRHRHDRPPGEPRLRSTRCWASPRRGSSWSRWCARSA